MKEKILFITADAGEAGVVRQMLQTVAVNVEHAHDLDEADRRIAEESYGAVVTEAVIPDGCWRDVLRWMHRKRPDTPLIVTNAVADAEFWLDALEQGAYDVLVQPFAPSEVQRIVLNALSDPVSMPQRTSARIQPAS
ncbi:MAG: response regulator [Bryobacterales bacterium]|nr:response regulator [Bryobacteraceae bacterium]MDW8354152.1 response regulator [Bryobacterales bacterium]